MVYRWNGMVGGMEWWVEWNGGWKGMVGGRVEGNGGWKEWVEK